MKINLRLKQQLFDQCVEFAEERHLKIQNQIQEIQEALTSETKSSAGDKHETGRAMLQLEREKVGVQLAEIEKVKQNLSKINCAQSSDSIGLGSVVFTSSANYFIAISAGHIEINSELFFAISPHTPIALLLKGKRKGDKIDFRDQSFVIKEYY